MFCSSSYKWGIIIGILVLYLINNDNNKTCRKRRVVSCICSLWAPISLGWSFWFLPGVIVFASDQEVALLMKAVKRSNTQNNFSWIGSDGWSERALVSKGENWYLVYTSWFDNIVYIWLMRERERDGHYCMGHD